MKKLGDICATRWLIFADPVTYVCDVCKKSVDEVVQCERCIKWFCCVYQNISEKMYDAIFEFSKLHWFCDGCESSAVAVFQTSAETGPSKDPLSCLESKITDLMLNAELQLTKVIEEGKNQIREAGESMKNTLSETIQGSVSSSLADNTIMDKDNMPSSSLSFNKTTSEVITTFLDEEKERSKRRLNVIIHNVEESSADNEKVRKEQDINTAMSIFNDYMGIKPNIVNALRIGKTRYPGPDVKSRLLKLTLASEQDKVLLLRNCTKLRNNPENVRKVCDT